jgi:hypothetical protein
MASYLVRAGGFMQIIELPDTPITSGAIVPVATQQ